MVKIGWVQINKSSSFNNIAKQLQIWCSFFKQTIQNEPPERLYPEPVPVKKVHGSFMIYARAYQTQQFCKLKLISCGR